jgi:hypothetical protein
MASARSRAAEGKSVGEILDDVLEDYRKHGGDSLASRAVTR